MKVSESAGEFLRILVAFFAYSVAVQALQPVFDSLYLRAGGAFLVTLLAVVAIDTLPVLLRGGTPTFGEGSYFYSARGFLVIVAFVLLAAVVADALRTAFALDEWFVMAGGAFVAAVVVFGGLVAYYRRAALQSVGTG